MKRPSVVRILSTVAEPSVVLVNARGYAIFLAAGQRRPVVEPPQVGTAIPIGAFFQRRVDQAQPSNVGV